MRLYLRKAEMQGEFCNGRGENGGCPLYRGLKRIVPANYSFIVFPSSIGISDKLTGGYKEFEIANPYDFQERVYLKNPTKVTIKGLTKEMLAV